MTNTNSHNQTLRLKEDTASASRTTSWPVKRFIFGVVSVVGVVWAVSAIAGGFRTTEEPSVMTHTMTRGDLTVTIVEQGMLESGENLEIKSQVRGWNTVLWIVDSGTFVYEGQELLRLDSALIQEQIDERSKYANWSQSAADRSACTG